MDNLGFKLIKPDGTLAGFVESFWCLQNLSETDKEVIVLPDGRMDLIFSQSPTQPFHITLSGLETHSDHAVLAAGACMFAISFKLLAAEFIFQNTISNILDYAAFLPLISGILMQET